MKPVLTKFLAGPDGLDASSWGNVGVSLETVKSNDFFEEMFPSILDIHSDAYRCYVKEMVPIRKQEFLLGRYCAFLALQQLNAKSFFVSVDKTDRTPIWPTGFKGSITHNKNQVFAVVKSGTGGVGIDCETFFSDAVAREIKETLVLPQEHQFSQNTPLMTLLFSAKESVYKSLYPSYRIFFDFCDVRIFDLDPCALRGEFVFQVKHPQLPSILGKGFFYFENKTVQTFVETP